MHLPGCILLSLQEAQICFFVEIISHPTLEILPLGRNFLGSSSTTCFFSGFCPRRKRGSPWFGMFVLGTSLLGWKIKMNKYLEGGMYTAVVSRWTALAIHWYHLRGKYLKNDGCLTSRSHVAVPSSVMVWFTIHWLYVTAFFFIPEVL